MTATLQDKPKTVFFINFKFFIMRYLVFFYVLFLIMAGESFLPVRDSAESSNFRLYLANERMGQPDRAASKYAELHSVLKNQRTQKDIPVERCIPHQTPPTINGLASFHSNLEAELRGTLVGSLTHRHEREMSRETLREAKSMTGLEIPG